MRGFKGFRTVPFSLPAFDWRPLEKYHLHVEDTHPWRLWARSAPSFKIHTSRTSLKNKRAHFSQLNSVALSLNFFIFLSCVAFLLSFLYSFIYASAAVVDADHAMRPQAPATPPLTLTPHSSAAL